MKVYDPSPAQTCPIRDIQDIFIFLDLKNNNISIHMTVSTGPRGARRVCCSSNHFELPLLQNLVASIFIAAHTSTPCRVAQRRCFVPCAASRVAPGVNTPEEAATIGYFSCENIENVRGAPMGHNEPGSISKTKAGLPANACPAAVAMHASHALHNAAAYRQRR